MRRNNAALERNTEIRDFIKNNGLYQWQIAEVLGVHDSEFSRILRRKMSEEMKQKILEAVYALREER